MYDIANNVKIVRAQSNGSVTTSGDGVVVDTLGFNSVVFGILVGTVTAADASNYLTFSIQEGEQPDGSDMATVDSGRVIGSAVLNSTAQADTVLKIGAVGTKRYVRLSWTETGAATVEFSAQAVLGNPIHAPVS